MQLELSDSDAWYVRSGLLRAIMLNQKEIDTLTEFLVSEEGQDTARTIVSSVEGAVSWMKQWDREQRQMIARLPEEVRPNLDGV